MKRNRITLWILFGLVISACTPRSAIEASTPAPTQPTVVPRTISFITPDGATLEGTLYGSGETAVVFSVMGNCKRGWEEMADLVAQNGMMALTYQWRGCRASGINNDAELQKFIDDARGAIKALRDLGAQKVILAGASLGGVASAKLAVEVQASGLIVIASPAEIPDWGFKVEAADLNTPIPKLFITAENDDTVAASKTQALYDLAVEPKEWQTYPGTAHGTDLFETDIKEELQQRILNFILKIASIRQPV